MEYNMENYLKQIVEDYEELVFVKLQPVSIPFLEEDCSLADARTST